MSNSERPDSLPQRRRGLTVAPSPLNAVKLELGIILGLGLVIWLVQGRVSDNPLVQYGLLGGFGGMAMTWLMVRTRRQVRQVQQIPHSEDG